ncbi:exosporium protein C [Peribacillus frigoritolerans]|uniref:exosporium protein C n=1 Tax=Peribacillus frigoritolerans TaxID=450367 RepID=UPI003823BD2E
MPTFLDSGSSVPSNGSGTLSIPVPSSPIKLAEFGLNLSNSINRVILDATVGVTAQAGNPTLLFKVFRDSGIILTVRGELQLSIDQNRTISFQAIDLNVPAGSRAYSITIELENPSLLNSARVVGPITFSGVAFTQF